MEALPIPVKNAFRKLGSDIRDVRLRRCIPVAVMAQRAFNSRTTLVKLEKGHPGEAIGTYATVLFALSMIDKPTGWRPWPAPDSTAPLAPPVRTRVPARPWC